MSLVSNKIGANTRDVKARIMLPNTSGKGNFPRKKGKGKIRIKLTACEVY